MGCLSEIISSRIVEYHRRRRANKLGILAFEAAKTMSRLVSLYKSLSDDHLSRLIEVEMCSQGVAYLNSDDDESFLVRLTCAERLEDLDRASADVARLGRRCEGGILDRFDLVYANLKLGFVDFERLDRYGSKEMEKRVERMEKMISATAELYASLESLEEMENWGKRMREMKGRVNMEIHIRGVEYQRDRVRVCKRYSLWTKSFDYSVGLMARTACIVFARICSVFGPYIPILPPIPSLKLPSPKQDMKNRKTFQTPSSQRYQRLIDPNLDLKPSKSEPISIRLYNKESIFFLQRAGKNNRILHAAGPTTVGGSGLALRYANVILLVEKYLFDPITSVDKDSRVTLYQMLPENLKSTLRSKLSKSAKSSEADDGGDSEERQREKLRLIMVWLAPMAHHTITWQMDRRYEKMKFDTEPTVCSWQTLHFSDRAKTEAAIAEVLVALSCICRSRKF